MGFLSPFITGHINIASDKDPKENVFSRDYNCFFYSKSTLKENVFSSDLNLALVKVLQLNPYSEILQDWLLRWSSNLNS